MAQKVHTGGMDLHRYYRIHNPDLEFESRVMPCSDGITRIVCLSLWFWEKLELLLEVDDQRDLEEITCICLKIEQHELQQGAEYDHAFVEALMYYIWRNYKGYCQYINGYANDNFDGFYSQCF